MDKKAREVRLLQELNEECVLSEQHWKEFNTLKSKRDAINISASELIRLERLIQEAEQVRLRRIQILGEISQLRGISLPQLTRELGIYPPA